LKEMRSPLRRKPLRNPGDSVRKEMDKLINEEVAGDYFFAAFVVVLAGLEWFRWYTDMQPQPVVYTVVASIAVAVAVYRIRHSFKRLSSLKLGYEGEAAVGQFLESLRNQGAFVLHDFPGEGFNLDHIVIHQSGIYVIETKTFSKPDRGDALITFDGERVLVLGKEPDRNPVVQARAGARWLRDLIHELTGSKLSIRPVVVFPGWFIQPTAEARASDVWVLNPKALPAFIGNSQGQLSVTDVRSLAAHLSRYARAELGSNGKRSRR
jgi:hypothetical protein